MRHLLKIALAALLGAMAGILPARADYTFRDANNAILTARAGSVAGKVIQYNSLVDTAGTAVGTSGNPINITCVSGCSGGGGGGLSVPFGGAIGANGTPVGFKDASGNFQPLLGDVTNGQWVNIKASVSIGVTGTFWQATQPVSIAAPVAVTGPLTDGQLRATAVNVICTSGCTGGGGGGAVTIADGADVTQGAIADAAATAGSTGTVSAKLRLMTTQLAAINTSVGGVTTALGTPFQAGGSIGNTAFGISGTLPAFASTPTVNIGTAPTLTVTGPLTDTQLRATAVPVSLTSTTITGSVTVTGTVTANLGTLNGAATAANQATAITALGTINTTLGSPMQQTGGSVTANLGTLNGAALAANQTNASQKTQIVDSLGNVIASTSNSLNVNITGGGGSGGTSSTFGATFPSIGTAAGMSQAGNMVALTGTSGNLNVQCANCSGSGASAVDEASFTAGTSVFAPAGGRYSATSTSGPLTDGQQGMAALTINRAFHMNLRNQTGTELGVAAAPLQVSLANTAANATALLVTGTGGTFPVTQSTSPWIIAGGGTAGSPGTAVLTIQGIASGTVVPVSLASTTITGTVTVSGTVTANAGTNLNTSALALETGGNLASLVTQIGAVTASPTANTVNDRLKVINTTLGTPFQAGGSIGNTTFAVTQGTASNLNATVVGAGTAGTPGGGVVSVQGVSGGTVLPVSLTSTTITGTVTVSGTVTANLGTLNGAATAAKQPAIGTAGSSSVDVLSVQGISGGTAMPVSLTSTTITGSVTVAQATAASLNATVVGTGTFVTQSAITAASGALASGSIAAGAMVDLLTMRGTKNNGTAAANSLLVGLVFNNTPLTLTDTQQSSLQGDANGYLKVNCITGCSGGGGGGTSSNFAAAFPTAGTAIGVKNGANMVNLTADGSSNLNVNVAAGSVTVTQTTASNLNAAVVGVGTAGSPSGGVVSIQGVASGTVVPVSLASTTVTGTVAVTQSGTWTVQPGNTANTTAWLVTGTGGTFPITAASGSIASGAIASGAVASGAFASGAVASGAYASGSLASGAVVDLTNLSTPITPNTATATKGILNAGQYNSTQATFTNGQQGAFQISSRGAQLVATGADTFNATINAALPAGTNLMGKVGIDQTTPGTTNGVALTQIGSTTVLSGNGTAGAGAQRMTIASDNTAFTVNPASATTPVSTMNSASANAGVTSATAFVFDDVSPTAITENSFGYGRMSANRNQYTTIRDAAGNERGVNVNSNNAALVAIDQTTSGANAVTLKAATTGGSSTTGNIAANNTTAVVVKGSAGTLYGVQLAGLGSAPAYLKIYNATSATCGSGTPVKRLLIPAASTAANGAGSNITFGPQGVAFGTGITYCVTTGIGDADTTAPAASTFLINVDWL